MTTTVLGIYNAAISAANGRGRLSSLSDASRERSECDIWYDQIRTQVFEAAHWPATRASARLALIKARDFAADWALGDPETRFAFSYALPANCLRPWYLTSYAPFTISFDSVANKQVLNTDATDPVLIYAYDQQNPAIWAPGLRLAVVYGLAAVITGPLQGSSSFINMNLQLANKAIMEARAYAAETWNEQADVMPEALLARGASAEARTYFVYPYGSAFPGDMANA